MRHVNPVRQSGPLPAYDGPYTYFVNIDLEWKILEQFGIILVLEDKAHSVFRWILKK